MLSRQQQQQQQQQQVQQQQLHWLSLNKESIIMMLGVPTDAVQMLPNTFPMQDATRICPLSAAPTAQSLPVSSPTAVLWGLLQLLQRCLRPQQLA
jgi:hypothetical protein